MGRVKRKYDYTGIPKTPFTIVVSLPEHDHSGSYRVLATEEIHRSHVSGTYPCEMQSTKKLLRTPNYPEDTRRGQILFTTVHKLHSMFSSLTDIWYIVYTMQKFIDLVNFVKEQFSLIFY